MPDKGDVPLLLPQSGDGDAPVPGQGRGPAARSAARPAAQREPLYPGAQGGLSGGALRDQDRPAPGVIRPEPRGAKNPFHSETSPFHGGGTSTKIRVDICTRESGAERGGAFAYAKAVYGSP